MSANHQLSKQFLSELKTIAVNNKTKIWFLLKEFIITGDSVPVDVAQKILDNFIIPLSPVREALGIPIYISKRSGYRPDWWEWMHGRSGTSEHTFKGMGAADLTCDAMDLLILDLKIMTGFTRICYYPHHRFVHVDYKPVGQGKRAYYEANSKGKWIFKEWL